MFKKLVVILGPTASGKSGLAIKLAQKFKGEIISADSRQVYKGMDIGTAKVTRDKSKIKEQKSKIQSKNKKGYFHKGIRHYLLDVASPKRKFTVVQYRKLALKAIDKIFKNNKLPILCGGSGFYIQAVVDGITIPEVKPDWQLRAKLNKLKTAELFNELKKLDPKRAKTIDKKNPRRLIRAIEIVTKIGPVPILKKNPLPYPVLMIGIKKQKKELSSLIRRRFFKWLKEGLINEVKNLRRGGLSWKKIEDFGIHYRVVAEYLRQKINKKEMVEKSIKEIQNYAKRQLSWWKSDNRIRWVRNYKSAEKLVKNFLRR